MSTDIRSIDTFDRDEIANFINRIFKDHYRNKNSVPLWTAEYLSWNMACSLGHNAFGAFNNGKLVGFIMGLHKSYQFNGKGLEGLLVSWLAADTSKSSHIFSFKLIDRILKSALRDENRYAKDIIIFYTDPSSGNSNFWKRMAPKIKAHRIKKTRFYAKIFNVEKVMDAEWHAPLGHQILKMKHFYGIPKTKLSQGRVRPFEKNDIDDCLWLLNREKEASTLSRMWIKEELENQLQYKSLANSLLYHKEDKLHGIVNYHLLEFIGRKPIWGAFLDFMCFHDLTLKEKMECLNVSLTYLKNEGCDMVLVSENGVGDKMPLFLSGFVNAQRSINMMMITNASKKIALKRNNKVFVELR